MSWMGFNRAMVRFNFVIAAGLWVIYGLLAARDWTVIFAPLFFTAVVAFQWVAVRKVYGPPRPRPDYAAITRMEREIYGQAVQHARTTETTGETR
jgi:hypothetical protein